MVIDSALAKKTFILTNLVQEFQSSRNAKKIRELGELLKKQLREFRGTECEAELIKCNETALHIVETMRELDSAEYTARAYRAANQVSLFLSNMTMGKELPNFY